MACSTVCILDGCVSDSLEYSLVHPTGMPFRTAHSIVGRIAADEERLGERRGWVDRAREELRAMK